MYCIVPVVYVCAMWTYIWTAGKTAQVFWYSCGYLLHFFFSLLLIFFFFFRFSATTSQMAGKFCAASQWMPFGFVSFVENVDVHCESTMMAPLWPMVIASISFHCFVCNKHADCNKCAISFACSLWILCVCVYALVLFRFSAKVFPWCCSCCLHCNIHLVIGNLWINFDSGKFYFWNTRKHQTRSSFNYSNNQSASSTHTHTHIHLRQTHVQSGKSQWPAVRPAKFKAVLSCAYYRSEYVYVSVCVQMWINKNLKNQSDGIDKVNLLFSSDLWKWNER